VVKLVVGPERQAIEMLRHDDDRLVAVDVKAVNRLRD
jgi:hypothetical protein